jgi:hypothetical protein
MGDFMPLKKIAILILVLGGFSLIGCSRIPYIAKANPDYRINKPKKDMAQVVFLNPLRYWGGITTIHEAPDGRIIGQSGMGIVFAFEVKAGEHFFVTDSEGTNALKVNAAAGKTYYVDVSGRPGMWSQRMHLFAIKPSMKTWPDLQKWLSEMEPREINVAAAQAYFDKHREDCKEISEKGRKTWASYSPQEAFERTLDPGDGI